MESALARRTALSLVAGLLASMACLARGVGAESGVTLVGKVMSSNEVSLGGAIVTLEGIGSVRTDAAGVFTFPDVSPGSYRLTVSTEGFPEEKRLVLLQEGRLNTIRVYVASPARVPAPPAPIAVPIVRRGSAILVRGHINAQVETLFLVDTGATLCVLTRTTAGHLGLTSSPLAGPVTVHTASGSIEAPLILVDLIQVGAAEAGGVEAIIHDVPGLPSDVGGLLGLSFLNRFTVEIDPVRGTMQLSR
jgi:clan AA aspartic protease (TIGR02281 family)